MRHGLTLLATATLALAGCGGKGAADSTANADTGLTADKIAANDVTAIDAVTGEAANMAADVNYSNLVDNAGDNSALPSAEGKPKAAVAAKPAAKAAAKPVPAPSEATNATTQ